MKNFFFFIDAKKVIITLGKNNRFKVMRKTRIPTIKFGVIR